MVMLTEQIVRGKTRIDKLEEVKNLNLWGQDIEDVSILAKMTAVEILSLSVNRISSLKDFRHCRNLQELYLRKNNVMDIADLTYLVPLSQLKVLWLCDNPIADHPFYRPLVAAVLPSVEKLDNSEVTPQEKEAALCHPELARFIGSLPGAGGDTPMSRSPSAVPSPHEQQYSAQPQLSPQPQYSPETRQVNSPYSAQQYSSGKGLGSPVVGSRPGSNIAADRPYPAGMLQPAGGLDAGRRPKNVLYAVMALVTELEGDDLLFVKREIEQRLGSMGQ